MENRIDKINNKNSSQNENIEYLENNKPYKKNISLEFVILTILASITIGVWLGLNYSEKIPQQNLENNNPVPTEVKQINKKVIDEIDQTNNSQINLTDNVASNIENYDVSPLETTQKSEWISVGWDTEYGGNIRSIDNFKAKFISNESTVFKAPIRLSNKKLDSIVKTAAASSEPPSVGVEIKNKGADYSGYKSKDFIEEVSVFNFKVLEATASGTMQFSIETLENGVIKDKMNNITAYAFSPDSRKLFTTAKETINNETFIVSKIKDIESGTVKILPSIDCINRQPIWVKNNLITLNKTNQEDSGATPEYTTDICIFDENGNILSRIDANLEANTNNTESYGILPNDSSIFYIFSNQALESQTSIKNITCSLFLLDTKNAAGNLRYVDLVEIKRASNLHSCSKILGSLDLRQLNFNSGKLAFRLRGDDGRFTPWVIIKNEI